MPAFADVMEAGQRGGDRHDTAPDSRDAADRLADLLADQAMADGPWSFYSETSITTPGLFWGLAGVGYALLHHLDPAGTRLPSILTAEVDPRRRTNA